MSILAHTTAAAQGLEAQRRDLDSTTQHEAREANRIQRLTGCSRTEALRQAAGPSTPKQCPHGRGFNCRQCWPTTP